jgi:eukaryotic-like serine/threonine-protein kinase
MISGVTGTDVSPGDAPQGFTFPRPLGRYELLEEIGRGGAGVVFKARQPELERFCAIKMLLAGDFANAEAHARLRTEAVAAGSLDHPHIVGIYDVGEAEGRLFFAMEFVEGRTLSQLSRAEMLPSDRVARYVRKIALAIQYAHSRGVLHRDLKPTNVIIDQNDEPQITDFGLTKRVHEQDRTTEGAGSPNFMAPEQASARFGATGVHTDVFGIGAILYFLLTDRPPFRGETLADTIDAVLRREPQRPRQFRPGVPIDLETICLKCLEKQSARRYASAQEVADELDRFLRDEPIHARPISWLGRSRRWCRRHPAIAALSAATAVLLLALAVGGPWAAYRIEHQRALTQQNLYAADMALAFETWESGGSTHVRELLERHAPEQTGRKDLRGWEWRFLDYQTHGDSHALVGRLGGVGYQAMFVQGGRRLLVSDLSGALTLWDWAAGRQIALHQLNDRRGHDYAVSTDQKTVVVASAAPKATNTVLMRLDAETLRAIGTTPLPGSLGVVPGSFGDQAVWLVQEKRVLQVDVVSGQVRREIAVPSQGIQNATAMSPDGRWLALVLAQGAIRVIDVQGQETRSLAGHETNSPAGSFVHQLGFSPDSRWLVSAGSDGTARLWDVQTGRKGHVLKGSSGIVLAAAFSADGREVATGGLDKTVRRWAVEDGRSLGEIVVSGTVIRDVLYAPGGAELLCLDSDQRIERWKTTRENRWPAFTNLPSSTQGTLLLAGGRVVGWGSERAGGFLRLPSGEPIPFPEPKVLALGNAGHVTADGSGWGATYLQGGTIAIISTDLTRSNSIQESAWVGAPRGFNGGLKFSDDGKSLLAGDVANGLRVYSVPELKLRWKGNLAGLREASISPTGRLVGAGGVSTRPRVWQTADNREIPCAIELSHVQDIAFSDDETLMTTCGLDGVVHVFRTSDGGLERRLVSRFPGLLQVAVSPDNKRVVCGTVDGHVCVWDLTTGRQMAAVSGHRGFCTSVIFTPEGDLLSSGADAVRYWLTGPIKAPGIR